MRKILPIAALLLATGLVWGQQKVSAGVTGGNPRGSTPPAEPSAREKAAAEKSQRDAAKKALGALKGAPKDKADKRDDRKPGGR
ncbi:MAG: hypothetical protein HZC22_04335 [Rhodocyclales bacterium]|nr:hypothetical protein [Rhodocyclales bacterium]